MRLTVYPVYSILSLLALGGGPTSTLYSGRNFRDFDATREKLYFSRTPARESHQSLFCLVFMVLSHKIQLNPTLQQITAFRKACGCSRVAYNWGLNRWKELKSQGVTKIFIKDIKKEFNSVKGELFPWIFDSPKNANQEAFPDLQKALKKHFVEKGVGFPSFRSRHKHMSFHVGNDRGKIQGHIWVAPLIGVVKMFEALRWPNTKILSYTVSETAGKWFLSVTCEGNFTQEQNSGNEVGIDLGLKDFAVQSNGTRVAAPKFFRKAEKKLAKAQKNLSRKVKGSKNRAKAKRKVQKVHYRIRCQRQDFLHKLSRKLVQENQLIGLETLSTKGLARTRLAKSILDAGWGEFVRQLEYKSLQTGTVVVRVGRFFPSTRLCSCCGFKNDNLTLKDRFWVCPSCETTLDRDLNASQNILAEARRIVNEIPTTCGNSKPVESKPSTPLAQGLTLKQESLRGITTLWSAER